MKNTINGKPLEFGDTEQIKFLAKSEKNLKDFLECGIATNDGRINIKAEVSYTISFKCFQCGELVSRFEIEEIDSMESVDDLIEDVEMACKSCKCVYQAENGLFILAENPTRPDLVTKIELQP